MAVGSMVTTTVAVGSMMSAPAESLQVLYPRIRIKPEKFSLRVL
jgi:hypothetical protein